jgi:hypothetical protein
VGDFLRFETMITPILIQFLFWLAVIASVIVGIGIMALGSGEVLAVAMGLALIILGPIVIRIWAEILMVIFRINDHLRQIMHNTQRS